MGPVCSTLKSLVKEHLRFGSLSLVQEVRTIFRLRPPEPVDVFYPDVTKIDRHVPVTRGFVARQYRQWITCICIRFWIDRVCVSRKQHTGERDQTLVLQFADSTTNHKELRGYSM